jgi:hypothetical protein
LMQGYTCIFLFFLGKSYGLKYPNDCVRIIT